MTAMSYCRFSSDNWKSDVYVYYSVGDFYQVHIASRKRLWAPPPTFPLMKLPSFGGQWNQTGRVVVYPSRLHALAAWVVFGAWAWWHNHVHMRALGLIPMRPIKLPFAGESHAFEDPADCAAFLQHLSNLGYHVPRDAIEDIRYDAIQESATC